MLLTNVDKDIIFSGVSLELILDNRIPSYKRNNVPLLQQTFKKENYILF